MTTSWEAWPSLPPLQSHSRDLVVHVSDIYSVQEPACSVARVVMANPNLGQGAKVNGVDDEGVCLGRVRVAHWGAALPTSPSASPSQDLGQPETGCKTQSIRGRRNGKLGQLSGVRSTLLVFVFVY